MKAINYEPKHAPSNQANRWTRGNLKASIQGTDEQPPYACVLSFLTASRNVRAALATQMGVGVFSEAQLVTLITLYGSEPMPSTVAAISSKADVSRGLMILVVDSLVARDFLVHDLDQTDRRPGFIRLTEKGREAAVVTAHLFLEAVDQLTRDLSASQCVTLDGTCRQLTRTARSLQAEATQFSGGKYSEQ